MYVKLQVQYSAVENARSIVQNDKMNVLEEIS